MAKRIVITVLVPDNSAGTAIHEFGQAVQIAMEDMGIRGVYLGTSANPVRAKDVAVLSIEEIEEVGLVPPTD